MDLEAPVRWGVYRAAEASSPANEAGFGSIAVKWLRRRRRRRGAAEAASESSGRCEPADVRDVERAVRGRVTRGSDVPLAPKAPDEFLSIYSPFNLISDIIILYSKKKVLTAAGPLG